MTLRPVDHRFEGPARRRSRIFWCLNVIAVVSTYAHILIGFPSFTLSTFELKARGTYIEHSDLLPNSAPALFRLGPLSHPPAKCFEELEMGFESAGLPTYVEPLGLEWSVIRPWFADDCKEALVVVFATPPSCDIRDALFKFSGFLRNSRWLSKTLILLAPSAIPPLSNHTVVDRVAIWLSSQPPTWAIRTVLVLELEGDSLEQPTLKMIGQSGRLPNQDLPNLVARAFRGRVTIEDTGTAVAGGEFHMNEKSATGFMALTLQGDTGIHTAFLRLGIDAITITNGPNNMEALFRAVESVLRSTSSLETRFQHGFYLYAFMGPEHFVSIGEYAITIALASVPICALCLDSQSMSKLVPVSSMVLMTVTLAALAESLHLLHGGVLWNFLALLLLAGAAITVQRLVFPRLESGAICYGISLITWTVSAGCGVERVAMAAVGPAFGLGAFACSSSYMNCWIRLLIWFALAGLVSLASANGSLHSSNQFYLTTCVACLLLAAVGQSSLAGRKTRPSSIAGC